jgi:phosphoglycolate phosphatase
MLHLVWDMDGTLVDSEPEIIATIEKSLRQVGVSMSQATSPLRIGPPVRDVIRRAFPAEVLSDECLDEAVKAFRVIYDTSDYEATVPFAGIDDLIHDTRYVHHVITNKPLYATTRILQCKGWASQVVEILTPDALAGQRMTKPALFQHCRAMHPDAAMVGIGDMAPDATAALEAGMEAVGVLWGTGTAEELHAAGCRYIVQDVAQLREILETKISL